MKSSECFGLLLRQFVFCGVQLCCLSWQLFYFIHVILVMELCWWTVSRQSSVTHLFRCFKVTPPPPTYSCYHFGFCGKVILSFNTFFHGVLITLLLCDRLRSWWILGLLKLSSCLPVPPYFTAGSCDHARFLTSAHQVSSSYHYDEC